MARTALGLQRALTLPTGSGSVVIGGAFDYLGPRMMINYQHKVNKYTALFADGWTSFRDSGISIGAKFKW